MIFRSVACQVLDLYGIEKGSNKKKKKKKPLYKVAITPEVHILKSHVSQHAFGDAFSQWTVNFKFLKLPVFKLSSQNLSPKNSNFEILFQAQSALTMTKGFEEVYLKNS